MPQGPATTVVSGLPLGGDHPMHPFLINADGSMYVDVATATNSCQLNNRKLKSPGADPCTELETRGGIWRYDANKTNQPFSPADRYATGIRNGEGFAIDASRQDVICDPTRTRPTACELARPLQTREEATLPAEELLLLKQGGDYGWPECYYDAVQQKLVLAPEYGGDGGNKVGVCANKIAPVAAFPAHWGPNGMVLYDKKQFPAHYRNGVFIAFHGSWDRAPYAQGGYNVVFQPLAGDHASGRCEIFADGFAGAVKTPEKAAHRPSGVAVGPDGSLYISDDIPGESITLCMTAARRWRGEATPCPSASAPAGRIDTACQTAGGHKPGRRTLPSPQERRKRWWPWAIAFTTVKWAELPARVAMARTVMALPWVPILTEISGCGAMAAMPESPKRSVMACRSPKNIAARCRRWAGHNSLPTR